MAPSVTLQNLEKPLRSFTHPEQKSIVNSVQLKQIFYFILIGIIPFVSVLFNFDWRFSNVDSEMV